MPNTKLSCQKPNDSGTVGFDFEFRAELMFLGSMVAHSEHLLLLKITTFVDEMDLLNIFNLGSALDSLMHYWELAAAATVVHLLFWRCSTILVLAFAVCCRSLAVLLVLSTAAAAVLFATAVVTVYLLSWCGLGACFCCLLSFICCLVGALYCCCCWSFIIAVLLVMLCLGVRFCCCCRSFAAWVMLYRVNLVLSAAASI
ncbi:hypothetical protein MAM1_0031c02387 [Mucor ambiguus]|uniref:Uncharacterized protein n=1 Tax=Mucor ambiguus TaxID=91626 RepID=A0A0C9MIM0_9FUNG|nr:hypothetical protein MAM1_0031c02387 [Mucor ambiguus]